MVRALYELKSGLIQMTYYQDKKGPDQELMLMSKHTPRVVGALVGDIVHEPEAYTKYRLLFEAVRRHFPVVGVYDATLRGVARMINALRVVHPDRQRWRERFYKNVPAFQIRSQQTAAYLQSLQGQADIVLQVGVLFDARWDEALLPSVIYTDYTAHLSARKPAAGRSPFTPRQLEQWITLERRAFERATYICTRSELVRDSVITDYGIPPEQVVAIGGGVNFATLPEPMPGANNKRPTVLFIGKDFYRKGGDLLLHAFALTRSQIPEAQLLLLTGDTIPKDLPLEGVELIQPDWDRALIETLYQRADLLVLPSRLETWGDVLLEAMAYTLPCIGVAGEAMEEIIENGVTGLIVPPEDVEALATALSRLLGNVQLRCQLGLAARQRIEQTYTWTHVGERLAPVIKAASELPKS